MDMHTLVADCKHSPSSFATANQMVKIRGNQDFNSVHSLAEYLADYEYLWRKAMQPDDDTRIGILNDLYDQWLDSEAWDDATPDYSIGGYNG